MLLEELKKQPQTLRQVLALRSQCEYTIWRRSKFLEHGNQAALRDIFSHFP